MKNKWLSGITLLQTALPALADEAAVAAVTRLEAEPEALIVSAVLFVAMIGGFFFCLSPKDNADRQGGSE